MSPVASTRWCPTPEQLMILEQMYRGGIKTPNASQIQQITAQLSLYGRIEGKNVFYWFQNHKARDRQRLRKKLLTKQPPQQLQFLHQNPLLRLFDASVVIPSGLPQLQYHYSNSSSLLYQEGLQESSPHVMNYKKSSQIEEMDENWERLRNQHELMNCMNNTNTTSATTTTKEVPAHSCCSRPLITLELFPIKSTCSIKDDDQCTTPKSLSLSPTS
ncbi:hypothetical protein Sjap_001649 [Stephania japonica]|uniref:Homeobox domain-containing protein n=1 Tax=Stephania japonica TaxID=461633 RepID=A0AAP0KMN0_9MAGN